MRCCLISCNESLFQSLGRCLSRLYRIDLTYIAARTVTNSFELVREFNHIGDILESHVLGMDRCLVLVDPYRADGSLEFESDEGIGPLAKAPSYSHLVSMLILAFPEVHFVVLGQHERAQKNTVGRWATLHSCDYPEILDRLGFILDLAAAGYEPLFDPANLRNRIRHAVNEHEGSARRILPVRRNVIASIDEEPAFAYMNAYTGFRFGYRAWAITSNLMMQQVFSTVSEPSDSTKRPARAGGTSQGVDNSVAMTLEDLYVSFADKTDIDTNSDIKARVRSVCERCGNCCGGKLLETHLSCIEVRDVVYPGLQSVKHRVIVTSGEREGVADQTRWRRNEEYLSLHTTHRARVAKPYGGMFDLWRSAVRWTGWLIFRGPRMYADEFSPEWRLNEDRENSTSVCAAAPQESEDRCNEVRVRSAVSAFERSKRFLRKLGTMRSLQWIVGRFRRTTNNSQGLGHSAPGRLLVIATRLSQRAERLLARSMTVPEAIRASVLALEARELLAGLTPTASLDALILQHRSEVSAETLSHGVRQRLNVKDRIKEIRKAVSSICRSYGKWYHPKVWILRFEGKLAVYESLAGQFRELHQFDEETYCQEHARLTLFNLWIYPDHWVRRRKYSHGFLKAWYAFLAVFLGLVAVFIYAPILGYFHLALKKSSLFLVLNLIWIVIFALAYWLLNDVYHFNNLDVVDKVSECWRYFAASARYYVTFDPDGTIIPQQPSIPILNFVLALQGLVAFFNLGTFAARLYLVLSRR